MSSSKQLAKRRNNDFFPGNDPRVLKPFPKEFTDAEKKILEFLPLPVNWTDAEKYFRRLPDSRRSYFPELGDPSRAQQGSCNRMMRYNDNRLDVECGQGSMQYYRRDPDGTISVINVRIDEFFTN